MIDHFGEKVSVGSLIKDEENSGFSLTRTMIEKLTGYEREKEKYPRMESFMPELVNAINCFDISGYKKAMREAKRNRVHYTCNIRNGSKNIPAGEFTVEIKFDKPMIGKVSLSMTEKEFPRFKDYSWSDDMRTFSIIFLFEEKHTYGFFIDGDGFRFIHVDFLMRYKGKCTLVEVKATTGNTKSTRTVLKNPDVYHMDSAIKLGDYNVGRSDKLLNILFYMAFLFNEP